MKLNVGLAQVRRQAVHSIAQQISMACLFRKSARELLAPDILTWKWKTWNEVIRDLEDLEFQQGAS